MSLGFTLKKHVNQLNLPVLMAMGEFDPLNPLEDSEKVYEALPRPKELWIFEDEFHPIFAPAELAGQGIFHFVAEWMSKALNGILKEGFERKAYIRKNGDGFYNNG